jgi:hypothetical protein
VAVVIATVCFPARLPVLRTSGSLTHVPEAFHHREGRGASDHDARPCHRFAAGIVNSWPAEREASLLEFRPASVLAAPAMEGMGGGAQVDGAGEERRRRAATAIGEGREGRFLGHWQGRGEAWRYRPVVGRVGRMWRWGAVRRATS